MGLEPTTFSLARRRSTTELRPQFTALWVLLLVSHLSVIYNERPDYTQNKLIRQPYYLRFSKNITPHKKRHPA